MSKNKVSPEVSLLILIFLLIGVGYGGYWVFENYLHETFGSVWAFVKKYWSSFSLAALSRGIIAWFMKMGLNFFLIEIPKRAFIFYVLPSVVIYFMPRFRRKTKVWVGRRIQAFIRYKEAFMGFLKTYLGKYAGAGIALIFATAFFLVFYSLFSVYLVFWIGLIKFPGFMVHFFSVIGKKIGVILQRIGFKKWALRMTKLATDSLWAILARVFPWLRWNKKSDEEKEAERKEAAMNRAKRTIKARYRHKQKWQKFRSRFRAEK